MSIVRVPSMARMVHVLLAATLLLMPVTALAAPVTQEGTLDPAVLAALERSSALVAAAAGKGTAAVPVPVEEPLVEEPPISPADLVIGPETEFEAGSFSILLPDTWTVEEDEWSGLPIISEEGTGFEIEVMDAEGAFPGLLLFPILEGNADLFIQSFGEGELVSVSRITSEDGLPGLRIAYTMREDGVPIAGALYFIVTGASAYGFMSEAAADFWPIYEPAVDAMVESIILDEDLITLQQAGPEGVDVTDANGRFALTVPADWYYSPVDDEDIGLSVGDAELAVVGAMMAGNMDASEEELEMLGRILSGEEDPRQLQELLDIIVTALDLGEGEDLDVDETRTATFTGNGQVAGTIRIVGDMAIEDGPTMTLTLYLSILPTDAAVFIFFGDPDVVEAAEPAIFDMVDSLDVLE